METVGHYIRQARERAGLTQGELAALVDIDQSGISRMESGKRPVATHELLAIAESLDTTTSALLGEQTTTAALALAGRLTDDSSSDGLVKRAREILEAADLLERVTGRPLRRRSLSLAADLEIAPLRGGRHLASMARAELGIGETLPVPDLAALLENRAGAHVAFEPMPDKVDGLCAAGQGASVILINCDLPHGRQRFTLAHELAHLLAQDLKDFLEITTPGGKTKGEKRADAFAAHFLAPDEALRDFVADQRIDTAVVGELVHYFGISLETACWRLQNVKLINEQQREALLARGLYGVSSDADRLDDLHEVRQMRGTPRAPRRLAEAALAACADGLIGLGLVADIYGVDDIGELPEQVRRAGTRSRDRAAAVALA